MNPSGSRRAFLKQTAVIGAGLACCGAAGARALGANDRVRLAVMGTNGRGSDLIRGFLALDRVEIATICDVDDAAAAKGIAAVGTRQSAAPRVLKDFRRCLEDPEIDAVVIAAPDHWHAPATVLACAAGKHVYVEKPVSHNPREGELAVAAARRYGRVVQAGTQRRSAAQIREALDLVRSGSLGPVRFARVWYNNRRGSIGRGGIVPVPAGLDWGLWQGPAPERPFHGNYLHYHWHWFWHWGTGELGNNAIHGLDLCRWALDLTFPRRVTSAGGRYHFDDDQETPDTQTVTFDFGHCAVAWEGRSCQRHGIDGLAFGVGFYGDRGSLVTDGGVCRVFDADGKETRKLTGTTGEAAHLSNFLDGVRTGSRPNGDIEEGHRSTLLCHLGNIAWRTGHALDCDPATGRILRDRQAMKLWERTYRPGWQPRV
jgi:predicted dehydrogenase